jgi:hypothetical protein
VKTACKEKGRCEKEKTFAAHGTSGDEELGAGAFWRANEAEGVYHRYERAIGRVIRLKEALHVI